MPENSSPGEGLVPDVLISHAGEDTEKVALPLADLLRTRRLRVWFDGTDIRVGDSIRRKIDEGLFRSRFGVVILSRHLRMADAIVRVFGSTTCCGSRWNSSSSSRPNDRSSRRY